MFIINDIALFSARSTWIAYAVEWGKLLKCQMKGKMSRKLANGLNHNIQRRLLVYIVDLRRAFT